MPEAESLESPIAFLQKSEEFGLHTGDEALASRRCRGDVPGLQGRHDSDCVDERGEHRNRDYPREELDKLSKITRNQELDREEHCTDCERGDKGRHKELSDACCYRFHASKALAKLVHIAVHRNDGIIHNHTQHNYQRRKGHRVQIHTADIHYGNGDGSADRDSGAGDKSRAEREEGKHHQDDHKHREQQVNKEGEDGFPDYLWLIGYPADTHALREGSGEGFEDLVHLLSEGDDVVVRAHLDRKNETGVTVIAYEFVRVSRPAGDCGYVFEPDEVACRIGIDYLFRYLLLGTDIAVHVHGCARMEIVKQAAGDRNRLALPAEGQGSRIDGIGRQLLPVEDDGYFLLLAAQNLDSCKIRDSLQLQRKPVCVILKLRVAFVRGFQGYHH